MLRCYTKRAARLGRGGTAFIRVGGFGIAGDVDHAVGSPQALEGVGNSYQRVGFSVRVLHGRLYLRSGFDCSNDALDRLINRHTVVLAAIAEAERDGTGLLVFATGNEHEGNLLLRGGADFLRESVIAIVKFGAHASGL